MSRKLTIDTQGELWVDHNIYLNAVASRGPRPPDWDAWKYTWRVRDHEGHERTLSSQESEAVWRPETDGRHTVLVVARPSREEDGARDVAAEQDDSNYASGEERLFVLERPVVDVRVTGETVGRAIDVSLQRTDIVDTPDLALWTVIRASTDRLSFNNYKGWMDKIFCASGEEWRRELGHDVRYALPFPDIVSYKALKVATQAFLMANCGVVTAIGDVDPPDEWRAKVRENLGSERFRNLSETEREERMGLDEGDTALELWRRYLVPFDPNARLYAEPAARQRGRPRRIDRDTPLLGAHPSAAPGAAGRAECRCRGARRALLRDHGP